MKSTVTVFYTYEAALKGASNAMKDGFNTIIHKIDANETLSGMTEYVNEYFVKDDDRT